MKKTDLAFTRIELLFCILGAALLLLPALSLLASNKSESQRIVCFNNLRQIGRAFQLWANEHNEMLPWQVETADGGTRLHILGGNLWFQFSTISNQLGTPKAFVCPADALTTKAAETWGNEPNTGFLSPTNRNNAISYMIALHAGAGSSISLLSGDRNIAASTVSGCSYLSSPVALSWNPNDGNAAWTNFIHGTSGHILFGDGAVQFTSSPELRSIVSRNSANGRAIHFMKR